MKNSLLSCEHFLYPPAFLMLQILNISRFLVHHWLKIKPKTDENTAFNFEYSTPADPNALID